VKDLDRSVYLLRVDSANVERFGMYSNAEIYSLIRSIPGAEELVRKILADPEKFGSGWNKIINALGGDSEKSLINKIFGRSDYIQVLQYLKNSPFARTGAEVEFRRKFVELYFHQENSRGSPFISMSSSIDLPG
jgi:hypothetical protein